MGWTPDRKPARRAVEFRLTGTPAFPPVAGWGMIGGNGAGEKENGPDWIAAE